MSLALVAGWVAIPAAAVGGRSDDAMVALRAGFIALDEGNFGAAVERYREALAAASGDEQRFQALFGLGAALDGLGDRDEACERFTGAVAVRPENPSARHSRATVCAAAGRLEVAIGDLEWLAARVPDDVDARHELLVAYAAAGDHARSAAAARQLLGVHPDDLSARLALGVALYHLGDYRAAVTELERVVAAQPANGRARFALGLALLYAGDRPRALEQYALLKESAPDLAVELYRSLFPR